MKQARGKLCRSERVFLLVLIVYTLTLPAHFNGFQWVGGYPFVLGDDYVSLTKSLVENQDLSIDEQIAWRDEVGLSGLVSVGKDGRFYSRYAPALSFIAVPFYAFGGFFGLSLLNCILSAMSIYVIYQLCRQLVDEETACKTTLLFAFTTMIYTYSQVFYAEALSGLMVTCGFYFLKKAGEEKTGKTSFLAGCMAGLIPASKPSLLIVSFVYLAFIFLKKGGVDKKAFLAGMFLALVPLLAYNNLVYASPFETGYHHSVKIADDGVLTQNYASLSFFSNQTIVNAPLLLLILIVTQPLLLLALYGVVKHHKDRNVQLILAVFIALLLLYGSWYDPIGGWSWSARLLYPIVPLLSIPFALSLPKIEKHAFLLNLSIYLSLALTIASLNFQFWEGFLVLARSLMHLP